MKLDILAIGVHPDDVELSCAGTILKHIKMGKKVGVLDLTKGELGTRGSAELRMEEAKKAAELMNLDVRVQLDFADGFFTNDEQHQREIIQVIRLCKPDIVLANAIDDRHPDHGRASKLISDACFYSGLVKVETEYDGQQQEAWRPKAVYHYIQDRHLEPDFVVDVSEFMDQKLEVIKAYGSQFFNPDSSEPETPISGESFLDVVKAKMAVLGRQIGVDYAEGYTAERYVGVDDITMLR